MAVSDKIQLAIPQTVEEATPLDIHEFLVGSSSGAATTDVGSTDLHLDIDYIIKSPLKATSIMATKVTTGVFKRSTGVFSEVSTDEGSPRTKNKGHLVLMIWDLLPKKNQIQPPLVGNQMIPLNWVMI
ncbi:hypothetical protein Hanom_Chr05g00468321 [Helianthus anomalus]